LTAPDRERESTGPRRIVLPQTLPGQEDFVIAWLGRREGGPFLVDPGPAATAERLLAALAEAGVDRLPLVLLTHIHLDHAGAAGHLARAFPEAHLVCHPRGIPHLVDPTRLWAGSLKVQGEVARVYGEPLPVPADRFIDPDAAGVRAVETPGHAPHHLSFVAGDTLYVGEAACTCLETPGGLYLRPATPPRFRLDIALASLARLRALDPTPARIAFAHQCLVEGRTEELLAASMEILRRWVEVAGRVRAEGPGDPEAAAGEIHRRLVECDPWYGRFTELEPAVQARELTFTRQSAEGIMGWLAEEDRA